MENEEWKDVIINGKSTNYMVSNIGRIFRKPYTKIAWNRHTFCERHVKSKIKKLSLDKDGYHLVTLTTKSFRVHRIVAEAFIPNHDNLPFVNHKNGIKKTIIELKT